MTGLYDPRGLQSPPTDKGTAMLLKTSAMNTQEHIKEIERTIEIYNRDFLIYCESNAITDFRIASVPEPIGKKS